MEKAEQDRVSNDPKGGSTDGRRPYRKPVVEPRGRIRPSLVGSPPPPPGGTRLGWPRL